jgi:AcrR family transcriptional regulator
MGFLKLEPLNSNFDMRSDRAFDLRILERIINMPRTSAENDRIRQATREHILKTALSLFCDKGYYPTLIEEIAKLAQISKGLLYHYFKSKAEVLAALVDLRIDEVLLVMNAAKAESTPADQIRHIVEGALADVQQQPDVFRFYHKTG